MNILYTFDDLFAEVAGISILSLFENNKDADEINVYAICDDVSDVNKQRLIGISESYERKIIFLDAPDVEKIASTAIATTEYWTLAAFYRLLISSILPTDMTKIIYIDSDTTVQSSLSGLWEMARGGSVISGVRTEHFSWPWYNTYVRRVFLKRKDIYINSGVMLINLASWRLYDVEEKFIKFIRLMEGKIPAVDQDVLNSVLKGYIGTVDPAYNFYHMSISEKDVHPKDKKRVREITQNNNPVIVHHLIIRRKIDKAESGWDNPRISYFRDDWYKWREMSPWKGLPLDHLRAASKKPAPPPIKIKRKTIRSSILRFTERKFKPAYNLLNNLGICYAAFSRSMGKLFDEAVIEPARIRKYNKHRQKVTGINIKDCRISKRRT
ncbi:MAG: glycosyltransferase family 8 protein [Oscillospiraceae bacterium]|nr:glycosyltransferase family 8 protein [Oscillospiraceae bacterium]